MATGKGEPGPATEQGRENGPGGLARVARRVSSWTSNLLVTAILLVAAVGFGRQVLHWWAEDGEAGPTLPAPAHELGLLEGLGSAQVVRFGDHPWSLARRQMAGSPQSAIDALRDDCCRATQAATVPEDAPGKAETALLADLKDATPVQSALDWTVYQLHEAYPMLVGLRPGRPSAEVERPNLAAGGQRVVTWAIAVPSADSTWTLLVFSRAADGEHAVAEVPLPPGGRRFLSVRTAQGGEVCAFRGEGSLDGWAAHFDRWAEEHGLESEAAWRRRGDARSKRYRGKVNVDVYFGPDRDGVKRGMVMAAP